MQTAEYVRRTREYLLSFLGKEGFELVKCEFTKEDGQDYLRVYIDLSDEERKRRSAQKEDESPEKEAPEDIPEEAPEDTSEAVAPGIGINDCAMVSRRLSKWLDREDFIECEYMLEVCSKGYLS